MALKWFNDFKTNDGGTNSATSVGEFMTGYSSQSATTESYTGSGLTLASTVVGSGTYEDLSMITSKPLPYTGGNYRAFGFSYAGNYSSTTAYDYPMTPSLLNPLLPGTPLSSAITPDGKFIYYMCTGPKLMRFDNTDDYNFLPPVDITASTSLTGLSRSVAVSPLGGVMVISNTTTAWVLSYNTSTGAVTTVSTLLSTTANIDVVSFSPDGKYCIIGKDSTPWFSIYKVSGTTFTALTILQPTTSGTARGFAWSPDGKYLLIAGTFANNNNAMLFTVNGDDTFTNITMAGVAPTSGTFTAVFPTNNTFIMGSNASSVNTMEKWTITAGVVTKIGTVAGNAASQGTYELLPLYPQNISDYGYVGVQSAASVASVWRWLHGGSIKFGNLYPISGNLTTANGTGTVSVTTPDAFVFVNNTFKVYAFSLHERIFSLSVDTTPINIAQGNTASHFWLSRNSFSNATLNYRSPSGVFKKASIDLTNHSLSFSTSPVYIEIEIDSNVISLYINGTFMGSLADDSIQTFNAQTLTASFMSRKNCGTSQSSTTLNSVFTDFYYLDSNGSANTSRLGVVTVDTYNLVADGSPIQWAPASGTTHFNMLNSSNWYNTNPATSVSTTTYNVTDDVTFATQPASGTVLGSSIKVVAKSANGTSGGFTVTSDGVTKTFRNWTGAFQYFAQYSDSTSPLADMTFTYVP